MVLTGNNDSSRFETVFDQQLKPFRKIENTLRTAENASYYCYTCGGQHGGMNYTYGTTGNMTYDSITAPTEPGSSAAGSPNAMGGGNGGGVIKLIVSNTITNNGNISSNGTTQTSGGGGAGGSIYITTGTLTGAGSIVADGGAGCTNNCGSGGGGRIAIYYTSGISSFAYPSAMISNVHAFGGVNSTDIAAAGTVYLKNTSSQTYGDLVVNNNNYSTTVLTQLPQPTVSVSTGLTSTVLSATNAFTNAHNLTNQLVGLYVDANISQNATSTIMDNSLFPILSNTLSSLTISSGNMTSVAVSGNTFKPVLYLDNFEVRGKARLDFTGNYIAVREGDVGSDNTSSFVQDGYINATKVDVNTAAWTTTANAGGTITTKCAATYNGAGSTCP